MNHKNIQSKTEQKEERVKRTGGTNETKYNNHIFSLSVSLFISNIGGLNPPIKRQRLSFIIKKEDSTISCF